ncbi:MAG: DUF2442 domain-containing protein [Candidatus Gracilibacteria bacterium]|nr:DUF2442 domain-containing protein [Candidatus Gracilibacteria bacterium]
MHFVKEATYIGDYNIKITFEDGKVKVFDMSPYLENNSLTFRPLKQKDIFKMFKIKGNTISWITGADISPDFLYEKGINKK